MTSPVVVVPETATFKQIVRLLDAHGIGAVRVVDKATGWLGSCRVPLSWPGWRALSAR